MSDTKRPSVELFLSDARGIYIPRDFAECVRPEAMQGVKPADLAVLRAGPSHEWYWEAWEHVLNDAHLFAIGPRFDSIEEAKRFLGDKLIEYTLHQDGDLWLIPVGMEWSDRENGYVWPSEEADHADR